MAASPVPGSSAPDVDLEGWLDGRAQRFRLSEQRGRTTVLAFYPGDDTPVCTKQMCSYSTDLDDLAQVGGQVWGISPQDLDSHAAFAAKRGIVLPLLADPDKVAIRAYGVGGLLAVKRSVFVVDGEGIVRWSHISALGLTFRDTKTLVGVLAAL